MKVTFDVANLKVTADVGCSLALFDYTLGKGSIRHANFVGASSNLTCYLTGAIRLGQAVKNQLKKIVSHSTKVTFAVTKSKSKLLMTLNLAMDGSFGQNCFYTQVIYLSSSESSLPSPSPSPSSSSSPVHEVVKVILLCLFIPKNTVDLCVFHGPNESPKSAEKNKKSVNSYDTWPRVASVKV